MEARFYGMKCMLAVGLLGIGAQAADASLAQLNGGSGYSGTLSANKATRKQQLICDPATAGPLDLGAPRRGSTSVTYDPSIVSLSGIAMATGYDGAGFVEVNTGDNILRLQDIVAFLTRPMGTETGYAQVFYHHGNLAPDTGFPADDVFGPNGEPSVITPDAGFGNTKEAGLPGYDTHSLFFTYKTTTPDSAISTYTIYADHGDRASDNAPDSLTGVHNGREFTLGPDQLSSATVSGNLAVPLPPAVLGGGVLLAGVGLMTLRRRARA